MIDFRKLEKNILERKKRKLLLLQSKRILLCVFITSLSFSGYYISKIQESEKIELEELEYNSYDIIESLTFLFSFGFLNASTFLVSRPYYLEEKERIIAEFEQKRENSLIKMLQEHSNDESLS